MPGRSLLLVVAALLAAPGLRAAPADAALVVSAAISLTDALRDIERAYVADGGGSLRFNFAASNVLARQIANGAPADVFISADTAQMQYAERAGAILPGSTRKLLTTRLAVVTPHGRPLPEAGPGGLAHASIRRIAIGDPAAVPAGKYAREYLERADVWKALEPKLLALTSVRAALAAVASGGADAGIVYESDAASSTTIALAFVVAAEDAPKIIYPAAIVARSTNRASAERFLEYLAGARARQIFAHYRFQPADPRTHGPTDPRIH